MLLKALHIANLTKQCDHAKLKWLEITVIIRHGGSRQFFKDKNRYPHFTFAFDDRNVKVHTKVQETQQQWLTV